VIILVYEIGFEVKIWVPLTISSSRLPFVDFTIGIVMMLMVLGSCLRILESW